MSKPQRHRRSVALLPFVKDHVERIAETRGISINRAIEDAVKLYSHCLEQSENGVVSVTIKAAGGRTKDLTYVL